MKPMMNGAGIVASEAPEEQAQDMPGVPEESPKDVGAGEPTQSAPTDGEGDENANVTPEEQKMYDAVVTSAYKTMYSEQGFPALVSRLRGSDDPPAKTIGQTAAMLMMSVKKSVEQSGKSVPDDVLFAAGQEIVSDLAEVAVGLGVIKKEQADDVIQASYFEGVKAFGQSLQDSGGITPEAQEQAKGDLAASGKGEALLTAGPAAEPPPAAAPPPAGGIANNPVGA